MLYVDANVFIHAMLGTDLRAARAADVLRTLAGGTSEAVTASLTVDEIVHAVGKRMGRAAAIDQGQKFLALPNLRIVPVARDSVAAALAAMREHERLRPRDAIHYAVARAAGCTQIVSDDRDFDGLAELTRVPLA